MLKAANSFPLPRILITTWRWLQEDIPKAQKQEMTCWLNFSLRLLRIIPNTKDTSPKSTNRLSEMFCQSSIWRSECRLLLISLSADTTVSQKNWINNLRLNLGLISGFSLLLLASSLKHLYFVFEYGLNQLYGIGTTSFLFWLRGIKMQFCNKSICVSKLNLLVDFLRRHAAVFKNGFYPYSDSL